MLASKHPWENSKAATDGFRQARQEVVEDPTAPIEKKTALDKTALEKTALDKTALGKTAAGSIGDASLTSRPCPAIQPKW